MPMSLCMRGGSSFYVRRTSIARDMAEFQQNLWNLICESAGYDSMHNMSHAPMAAPSRKGHSDVDG